MGRSQFIISSMLRPNERTHEFVLVVQTMCIQLVSWSVETADSRPAYPAEGSVQQAIRRFSGWSDHVSGRVRRMARLTPLSLTTSAVQSTGQRGSLDFGKSCLPRLSVRLPIDFLICKKSDCLKTPNKCKPWDLRKQKIPVTSIQNAW